MLTKSVGIQGSLITWDKGCKGGWQVDRGYSLEHLWLLAGELSIYVVTGRCIIEQEVRVHPLGLGYTCH